LNENPVVKEIIELLMQARGCGALNVREHVGQATEQPDRYGLPARHLGASECELERTSSKAIIFHAVWLCITDTTQIPRACTIRHTDKSTVVAAAAPSGVATQWSKQGVWRANAIACLQVNILIR
jgi:hypothetical protein